MVCGQVDISGICIGGRTFGLLGLQVQPDGSSVNNIFEGLFTEEEMVAGTDIFEGGFNLSASEARKKFDSTTSADQRSIGERSGIEQSLAIYDT